MRNICLTLIAAVGIVALLFVMAGCSEGGNSSAQLGGNTVTLSFTDNNSSPCNPVCLAFQDGTRAWQRVPIQSSGQYTLTVTNAARKYGIAFVENSTDTTTAVIYATTHELNNIPLVKSTAPDMPGSFTISGSITGNNNHPVPITCDFFGGAFFGPGYTSYQLTNVPQGMRKLLAANTDLSSGPTARPTRMFMRNIQVDGDMTNVPETAIDLNGSESFPLSTQSLTGLPNSLFLAYVLFAGGGGFQLGNAYGDTLEYSTLPLDKMPNGGLYAISYSNNSDHYITYSATPVTSIPNNIFPTALNRAVTLNEGAVTWQACPGAKIYVLDLFDDAAHALVYATPGWLGESPRLTLPTALASLDGWQSHTYLPGTINDWRITAVTPSVPLAQYLDYNMMGNGTLGDGFTIVQSSYEINGNAPNVLHNSLMPGMDDMANHLQRGVLAQHRRTAR
ncbi:MAG TPA: hypothetical protein VHV83_00055 [Armatimonadota bacterium]|nr:hypothetical protein [Armatimonadota bacterium]